MMERDSKNVNNNKDIYDIICYYKDDDDNENQVKDIIDDIEKATKQQQQQCDKENSDSQKWIRWNKLFGCLLMNILLSSPIYGIVTIYLDHKERMSNNIALIWLPIIFNAVYLLVTPWLFNSNSFLSSLRFTNRNVIIIFTLLLSGSISLAGFTFAYLNANFFLILLLYGIVGGMSSCVIYGKMFVIINGILNNERLHLINFIYSFGTAVSQFLFPLMIHFVIHSFCYNCSIIIIGALILNIIPIAMIVLLKRDEISIQLSTDYELKKKFPIDLMRKNEESRSRYADIASASYDFYPDIKYPSDVLDMDVKWNNPSNHHLNNYSKSNDDHFLEILDSNRVMNSDGVEILETIAEEDNDDDEDEEMKFPEGVTIEEVNEEGMNTFYEEINRKFEMQNQQDENENCNFIKRFVIHKYQNTFTIIYRQIINPLRRSFKIFQFYPAVILKSIDIFSYLLYVTLIMPHQALRQYRFENRENVVYLITLMGFCWIIYSITVLKFHKSVKQNYLHCFHLVGLLAKLFGYLFTNQRYSFNGFLFGIILISLGMANSFHLQETVIRNCFHPRKWYYLRGPIYSFSGFLILIYCIIFHILHSYLNIATFTNIFVLFNFCCILIWLLTNYEMVIYVCTRY